MGRRVDTVTAFLRHGSDILLVRRSNGAWDAVSQPITSDFETALGGLLDAWLPDPSGYRIVRHARPVPVRAASGEWRHHPVLVEVSDRRIAPPAEATTVVWDSPESLSRRRTVSGLWAAYRRCGPSIATVRDDHAHGSSYVSLRAIEALRDLAVDSFARRTAPIGAWSTVRGYALDLAACRPELVVVGVRIDHVMHAASGRREPEAVIESCERTLDEAITADRKAADHAERLVTGASVLTISRAETVVRALREGAPDAVWVMESRPGREGVAAAEAISDGSSTVTLVVDAAASHVLEHEGIDLVLVGADAIGPSGTVRNKVGTRTVAHAAQAAGVPVYVVTATDKISPNVLAEGPAGPTTPVYDGKHPIRVTYPLFDRTPSEAFADVITEVGRLEPSDVRAIAERHRTRRRWRDDSPGSSAPHESF